MVKLRNYKRKQVEYNDDDDERKVNEGVGS